MELEKVKLTRVFLWLELELKGGWSLQGYCTATGKNHTMKIALNIGRFRVWIEGHGGGGA